MEEISQIYWVLSYEEIWDITYLMTLWEIGLYRLSSLQCMIYFSYRLEESYIMVRYSFFFTKCLYFSRYFDDIIPRSLWKKMMFYLFIESSKDMMNKESSLYISRGTRLKIEPSIFAYSISIDYFHTDVIHHKYKSKMYSNKNIDGY